MNARIVAVCLLFAAGCGKSDFVVFYEDMVDQVCACQDLKCVDDVNKESERKIKAMAETQAGSYSDKQAVDAASVRRAGCIAALKATPSKDRK